MNYLDFIEQIGNLGFCDNKVLTRMGMDAVDRFAHKLCAKTSPNERPDNIWFKYPEVIQYKTDTIEIYENYSYLTFAVVINGYLFDVRRDFMRVISEESGNTYVISRVPFPEDNTGLFEVFVSLDNI
jgi:hypothetical protein